ncbi:regulatory protein RecX [Glaciecola sp. 2405UD65-10]|uniref:regulatory protein RecX n=1 Tax=Glaciecola sp. 2405UD65-10 TaxID=3397244 RepID=UPI003B5AFF05
MTETDTKIINHAITRFLARREHSYAELLEKLLKKGFDENKCEQQLRQFKEKNIQSNSRFVESFVRNAYMNGKGPQFIRQSMYQHQINEQDANEFISSEEFDWYESATRVREKRFGSDMPIDFTAKQKQMRFLQYRGFEQAHINHAFE